MFCQLVSIFHRLGSQCDELSAAATVSSSASWIKSHLCSYVCIVHATAACGSISPGANMIMKHQKANLQSHKAKEASPPSASSGFSNNNYIIILLCRKAEAVREPQYVVCTMFHAHVLWYFSQYIIHVLADGCITQTLYAKVYKLSFYQILILCHSVDWNRLPRDTVVKLLLKVKEINYATHAYS